MTSFVLFETQGTYFSLINVEWGSKRVKQKNMYISKQTDFKQRLANVLIEITGYLLGEVK